jgi:hypothetical protein
VSDAVSEDEGHIFSFIDLVGFDHAFTQKIMEGSSFHVNNNTSLMQQDGGVSDSCLQTIIADCNDNNLFSLRNLLLAIEGEDDQ